MLHHTLLYLAVFAAGAITALYFRPRLTNVATSAEAEATRLEHGVLTEMGNLVDEGKLEAGHIVEFVEAKTAAVKAYALRITDRTTPPAPDTPASA